MTAIHQLHGNMEILITNDRKSNFLKINFKNHYVYMYIYPRNTLQNIFTLNK